MRKYLVPAITVGLLASAAAFAAGSYTGPSYQKEFRPQITTQSEFETVVHNGDIASCVKEVAKSCDADFEKKIAGKVIQTARGRELQVAAAIPSDGEISSLLQSKGVSTCAHITSKSGATSTDYFVRNGQLIIYKTSRANPCRASTISLPGNDPVASASASAFRTWITTKSGKIYYMTSTTNVQAVPGFTAAAVSADGSTVTLTSARGNQGFRDVDTTSTDLNSRTVGVERSSPLPMTQAWTLLTF